MKYNVPFNYTMYGSMTIEADSIEEADDKATALLANEGVYNLEYNEYDHEFNTQDITELKT